RMEHDGRPLGLLITQRSRVQIPPPPPRLTSTFGASPPSQRDSRTACCQSFVSGGSGLRSGPFVWAGTIQNQAGHGVRGPSVHAGDDVAGDVKGDGDGGVAEALADHLGRNPGGQGGGGVTVADIMEPDRRATPGGGRGPDAVGGRSGGGGAGRRNKSVIRSGWMAKPSGRANARPESIQADPTSARSCCWRA